MILTVKNKLHFVDKIGLDNLDKFKPDMIKELCLKLKLTKFQTEIAEYKLGLNNSETVIRYILETSNERCTYEKDERGGMILYDIIIFE